MFQKLKKFFKLRPVNFCSIDLGETENTKILGFETAAESKSAIKLYQPGFTEESGHDCHIAIPSSLAIVKSITIDTVLNDIEIENFLTLNAEQYLDCSLDKVDFDYKIIKQAKNQTEIKLVAVRKELFVNCIVPLKNDGFIPKIVNIDLLALVEGVSWLMGNSEFPYAIINIDQKRLLFCVLCNNEIIYFHSNYSHDFSVTSEIVTEIGVILQLYNSLHSLEIRKIVLSGTCALNQGLVESLVKYTHLPVEVADFSKKILQDKKMIVDEMVVKNAPKLLIAFGLALRALNYA